MLFQERAVYIVEGTDPQTQMTCLFFTVPTHALHYTLKH